MASYVAAFKGYIADVPEVWFKRCDGKIFHYNEVTQAQVNPQTNFTEVNAGWSMYPVTYLPGQSTMEISMTSGQFDADMFAMANNRSFGADAAYTTYVTETLTIDATTHSVNLANDPVANSVVINGLEQGETAAEGVFTVTAAAGETPAKVTFDASESGTIDVTYEVAVEDAKAIDITNQTAAVGEVVCKWPVYPSSDDCADAAVKGYVVLKMYRARVTAMPGFDTSLTYRFPAQKCA